MNPPSFVDRLKRARVVQVLLVYVGASWAVLQAADFLQSLLDLPSWVLPVAFILLLVGLVIILATAWIQSLPSTAEREEAGEVPTDWQVAPGDVWSSLKAGRIPHLTWGRAILGGLMALSLLFGVAGAYVLLGGRGLPLGPAEAGADEAATGIAVVPFSVNGTDLEVWREGMVDVLSTSLDGLGGFRAIDSRTVLARWHGTVSSGDETDLTDALRVAGATGARYALLGSAVAFGDQVRLSAELYDVVDGAKVGQARREGRADDVLRLSDGLAVDVIRALLGSQGGDLVSESQVASLTTSSLEALRQYLLGESLIRQGDFERAASAYEAAVDQDSTFASAYYRLTQAYGWMEAGGDAAQRAELALRALKENLPARDRLILEGEEALAMRDPRGILLMEDAVKRYPDDPDAWILLGEHYVHLGERLARTPHDTRRAYATAAELDPGFAPTYIHYAETAMRLGDREEARSLIDRYRSLSVGTHQGVALALAYDLQFGDPEARQAAVPALDTLASHTAGDLLNGLAFTPEGKDALLALARAGWSRTRSVSAAAGVLDAALSRGRLGEARQIGAEEDRLSPEWVGHLLKLAGAEPGSARVAPPDCEGRALCLVIVGVEAVDERDSETLSSVRAELERGVGDAREGGNDWRAGALEQSGKALEGYGAWRRGDLRGASSTLSDAQSDPATPWQVSDLARVWMGQIAGEEGRIADAAALFTSLEQSSPLGWYGVLLKARLHAGAGNTADSQREYRRFLDLWSEAPPDHPYVLEARAALPG